jgi:hypothetical protein
MRNNEAIKLYRDILRATRHFTWNDIKTGEPWRLILQRNARKEFEQARKERDALMIARMLVTGRQALDEAIEKLAAAAKALQDNIDKSRTT